MAKSSPAIARQYWLWVTNDPGFIGAELDYNPHWHHRAQDE